MKNLQSESEKFKKILGIEYIISVRFSNIKNKKFKKYQDTVCTALARSLKNNVTTYIDRHAGQLCPGGDYFLGITHPSQKEVCDVYVKNERVFQNRPVCRKFLSCLPKYPISVKKRCVLMTPLAQETQRPKVVLFLANSAQVGRILGLGVFKKFQLPHISPAGPTCLSLFVPLIVKGIHLNFIDYYDRYYQCVRRRTPVFKDGEMIVALPYSLFSDIIDCVEKSPHGSFEPNLKPAKVSKL